MNSTSESCGAVQAQLESVTIQHLQLENLWLRQRLIALEKLGLVAKQGMPKQDAGLQQLCQCQLCRN